VLTCGLASADLYAKAKDDYVKFLVDVCMPRYLVPKEAAQDFAVVWVIVGQVSLRGLSPKLGYASA
jgi:hypothetical protein